ncbi:MAG: DNA mismatch repair endonuclease MutL [Deltaproteobacteria bacterium]|nr:DNA mismatch repair endonuclease MutL [Deltaproteobacteria bacterium]
MPVQDKNRIKILPPILASKIAAGEVVERPASVVKELVENSVDAGATTISVYLAEGGKRGIRVVDDGTGMGRDDATIAFHRHSTSKISTEADLDSIKTMGFRGEALASISTVSRVVLRTKRKGEITGTKVTIEGGAPPRVEDEGCPEGTTIEVSDIFFNTPGRKKFLRSIDSEFSRSLEVIKATALSNPGIRFKLTHGSKTVFDAPAGSLKERIRDIFGNESAEKLIAINSALVKGFIGSPEAARSTARTLFLYVNHRWVHDKGITRAVINGYGTFIEAGRYPFAVLDIITPPEDVDVNIHPAKSEVRFKNQGFIYDIVKAAIVEGLAGRSLAEGVSVYGAATIAAHAAANEDNGVYDFTAAAAAKGHPALAFTQHPSEVKTPLFLDLEICGQIWGEFLIVESGEEFYIIDQHGAAERAAFERLKNDFKNSGRVRSQALLLPERVETAPEEHDTLIGATEDLASVGFEITPFGGSSRTGGETFLIKSVPGILSGMSAAALIKDIASELVDSGGSIKADAAIEAVLMRIACHSIIRGSRPLTEDEAKALLKSLSTIDFSAYCPHGRPVIKRFSRSEVDAMFKR